ncbi:MAG: MMPL family transporter [Deltaproteobacteria bacterium]|nr:MMPL family transporter [Deltaproteobacteria bacterium]
MEPAPLPVRRRSAVVVILWVVFALAAAPLLPGLFLRLKGGGFEDPAMPAWQVLREIEDRFHAGSADVIALVTTLDDGAFDDVFVTTALVTMVADLERDNRVRGVLSPLDGLDLLSSRDKKAGAVVITLYGEDHDKMKLLPELRMRLESACAGACAVDISGIQPVNLAVSTVVAEDLARAELLALPFTLLVLLLVFRGLRAALIPVAVAGLAGFLSLATLGALTRVVDVSIFAVNITSLLALGLAIDSSLFLVTRFREEAQAPAPDPSVAGGVEGAVRRTMKTTGRAVAFSGVVVAVSLAGLFVFPQALITSIGLAGLITTTLTLALALTLTPAVLRLWGWHMVPARAEPFEPTSTWLYRTSKVVMRFPVLVAVVTGGALVTMAGPFARFEGSIPDWRQLPEGNTVRRACAALDERFLPNLMTPHEMVVTVDGDALSADNLQKLARFSDALAAVPGVSRVVSPLTLAQGVSATTVATRLADPAFRDSPDLKRALNAFAQRHRFRFAIYSDYGASDPRAVQQAAALQALRTEGITEVTVGGVPAVLLALKQRVAERTPWMIAVVFVVMFVVLGFAFRSVIVPLKAMLLNVLSLTASFGAIVWVFQEGRGADLFHFTPTGVSDVVLPVLLFALCFGLSMDYEVLLLARVREEVLRRPDDTREAVARGLAATGRSIGSAALLFCIVVGAFATSRLLSMKALGVGLALAVALDATIVRGVLAPAGLVLLGRWNWWPDVPPLPPSSPPAPPAPSTSTVAPGPPSAP